MRKKYFYFPKVLNGPWLSYIPTQEKERKHCVLSLESPKATFFSCLSLAHEGPTHLIQGPDVDRVASHRPNDPSQVMGQYLVGIVAGAAALAWLQNTGDEPFHPACFSPTSISYCCQLKMPNSVAGEDAEWQGVVAFTPLGSKTMTTWQLSQIPLAAI